MLTQAGLQARAFCMMITETSGYRPPLLGTNRTAKVTFPLDPLESRDGLVITYKMAKGEKD